ncbi:DUF5914 domain-containing protein [Streptomyces flaveolus]
MNQGPRPRRGRYPLRLRRRPVPRQRQRPTWREARPAVIAGVLAPALRPLMRAAAGRLWRDDLAHAERRRDLRRRGLFPG